MPTRKRTTILHISDLHFGRNFVEEKWKDLQNLAQNLKPDLVVVTGDLVESPWRWKLKEASRHIETFRKALNPDSPPPLCCIAGNHDTRLQGVFPVQWLMPTAFVAFLGAVSLWWLQGLLPGAGSGGGSALSLSLFGLFAIAGGLRLAVTSDAARSIGASTLLRDPRVFKELGIGIAPFDSSSTGLSWARGRVTARDLVACRAAIDSAEKNGSDCSGLFWIAAVHHHPLPLPYDSDFEQMMVMDNAGALLAELAKRKVRLVLHGHKHHQHFARIAIDPSTSKRLEVAVLSAGTPTQGRRSLVHKHGFNIIHIEPDHTVSIKMFESEGDGTFVAKEPFDMVPADEQARLDYEARKTAAGLWCRRLVCTAEINEYGDAHFVREFRGVATSQASVKSIPGDFNAHSEVGYVEGYRSESLSAHGPGVTLQTKRKGLNHLSASVVFKSSGLQAGHAPIDFLLEFESNNVFALNRWQFSQMYDGASEQKEAIQFVTPSGLALEELVIHVRFSGDQELPKRLDLRWRENVGEAPWSPLEMPVLVRMVRQKVIEARILHPKENAAYQINWDLDDDLQVTEQNQIAVARALRLRTSLNRLASARAPVLSRLVEVIQQSAMEELGSEGDAFDVALFAYDKARTTLRCINATYPAKDERHQAAYPFGLGIAGRTFKAARTIVFVKPHDEDGNQPTGYISGNGEPVEPELIPEEAIVACALSLPEARDWPYAVVQISSDTPSEVLTMKALGRDSSLESFALALGQALTEPLERVLREAGEIHGEGN